MESKLVFVGVVVFFNIFGVMARARLQTILPSTQFHNCVLVARTLLMEALEVVV